MSEAKRVNEYEGSKH